MRKVQSHTNQRVGRGFSLIEVVLSCALLALLVGAFIGAYLSGQESSVLAGNRARAAFLAEEGIEAARNIRDAGFTNLISGTYGIATTSNKWSFSGSSDIEGIFTRTLSISRLDSKRAYATSTVTWQQNLQRTGSVVVATEFSNWQALQPTAANALVMNTGSTTASGTSVQGTTIQNSDTSNSTVVSMTLVWSGVSPATRIQNVLINGASVWTGSANSGTVLAITNTALVSGAAAAPVNLVFSKSMPGVSISITFTMSDGSSTTTPTLHL